MSDNILMITPAIACARSVLPQPGGPCNKKPLGGRAPSS